MDEATKAKCHFDTGRVLICTSMPDITIGSVILKIDEVDFPVRVIKEPFSKPYGNLMDFQISYQDSFSSLLNESVNSECTFVQDSVLRYDIPLKKMDHPSLANGPPQNIVDCSGASTSNLARFHNCLTTVNNS